MITDNMKWYVIRCASGQEKKAKKHIENKIGKYNLLNHVSRLVIPTRKEVYIKSGKKINREVNFYPGYILIEGELVKDILHIINETPGVINILGTKDKKGKLKPSPLREDEVNKFLGKIDGLIEDSNDVKHEFIIGESVLISDGPFVNFNGIIEEINNEKRKLKVSIKIFGRKTPVELDFSQIIKN